MTFRRRTFRTAMSEWGDATFLAFKTFAATDGTAVNQVARTYSSTEDTGIGVGSALFAAFCAWHFSWDGLIDVEDK